MHSLRALITLVIVFTGAPIGAAPGKLSLFDMGQHCVAYKTKKKLMLVSSVTVVGQSCDVSSQVVPDLGGFYYFEMTVPVSSLNSGEVKRDKDVAQLLSGSDQSDLIFRSVKMMPDEWKKLLKQEEFELAGEMLIKNKPYPVKARVKILHGIKGLEVDGRIVTKFKDLGIDPPNLAAGLMAKVGSDLELHFHFLADKTLGASNILPDHLTPFRQ